MITIIDYGMGNVGSIKNMLKKIGHDSIISSNKVDIDNASKLILPGVGRFDTAMENLNNLNLSQLIKEKVMEGTPLLGICLGMQLLANKSEEGIIDGLGLIPGEVKKFDLQAPFKVPHMGWNTVNFNNNSVLFQQFQQFEEARFYFVHSYYFQCTIKEYSIGETSFSHNFTSAVQKGNVFGVQFHPEKSHVFGMGLLKNFAELI
jgi:glutamine amidotransferase